MAEDGGAVGKLWKKHGGGYYALLAVGTFLYLEFTNLVESIASASSVRDFLFSELIGFFFESLLNSLWASIWPLTWYRSLGVEAFYWAGGGYLVWALVLALILGRREKKLREELGL